MHSNKKNNNKNDTNKKTTILKTALLLLACLSMGFIGGNLGDSNDSRLSESKEVKQQIIASESQLISEIAKNVGPSVVSVNVTGASSRSFFGEVTQQQSAGTGVIVSESGIIITNRHVVPSGTTSVSVTLSDGTTLKDVSVIGRTSDSDSLDVAFLKINDLQGKVLVPATIGDSSEVQVGDKVVAIGNALGQFQNTVTSGIISGFGRNVEAGDSAGTTSETLQNLFQTDTAINQGNSGGPLVNTSGEVIGINTAVAGNAENIGFAIPVNDLQGLINSVLKEGKLLRPYLGVRYVSLTDDIAYRYNLTVKRGAYLAPSSQGQSVIMDNSPAQKAGLKEKDIITKIDNVAIDDSNSLTSILGRHSVGDKVKVTIIRNGEEQSLTSTLEAAPSQ
ncbi:trypsin-like peptidase domain-containing protein [Candidatus Saccharibacteria bacterium]|nr:trypsin-like peptidase domain-containing protein [Candidatus Saccharibacteria bacterium]